MGSMPAEDQSPYVELDRSAWAALAESMPLPLSAEEVERLRGLGEELDLGEVSDVYLPISRLLQPVRPPRRRASSGDPVVSRQLSSRSGPRS